MKSMSMYSIGIEPFTSLEIKFELKSGLSGGFELNRTIPPPFTFAGFPKSSLKLASAELMADFEKAGLELSITEILFKSRSIRSILLNSGENMGRFG